MMNQPELQPWEQILAAPLAPLREAGIGFVGSDIPVELLLASGRPFGHLPWRADAPTPAADRWLESSFPGWTRSILEQWFAGAFDGLHAVVFSRADDAAQRLCYYVRELQARGRLQGPSVHMLDVALVPRETSVVHTAAALDAMAGRLGIAPDAWPAALGRANQLRGELARLQVQRGGPGAVHERMLRAALWSDATRWMGAATLPGRPATRRVLLAGSMPPDDRLHRAVDAGGACIVDELHPCGPARLGPPIEDGSEAPTMRIARHLQRHASGPRAVVDRAAQLLARLRESRASAVILWLSREDESSAWQVPAQTRALREAGIPLLVLPDAQWTAEDGALQAVTRFCGEEMA